ncbi:MAG: rRNA maturation RNase YbeY [Candidatus Paceibacterota bacterium]
MIEINNLTLKKIDLKRVKAIVSSVLKLENVTKEISIAFINDSEMRKINRRYRNIDKATDVLSFVDEGEIIICPNEISDFEIELKRVLIHGVLHLLGYDHEKDQGEMIKKQENYFSLIKD